VASGASILLTQGGTVVLLASVAESNERCFADHQLCAVQKGVASLHLKRKLESGGFHAGKLTHDQMNALNGRAIGLRLPPILNRDQQRFGHIRFMHGGLGAKAAKRRKVTLGASLHRTHLYHVKEQLQVEKYLRYVDDFSLFSDDRDFLADCRTQSETYLATLRLKIHPIF
jgi:hypothetical protein